MTATAAPWHTRKRAKNLKNFVGLIRLLYPFAGHHEAALTVYTREAFPQNWAKAQSNLGVAYRKRIKGSRADNIEAAIKAYEAALTVFTRETFPQNWAMTQHNLGSAYNDRIQGSRADNTEAAIKAYEATLTVYTREDFPQDWAMR